MIRSFLICFGFIVLFLGYVGQRVNLVRLSYDIDHKEKVYAECLEEQKQLRFKVAYLKSPGRLDATMSRAKINFELPREIRLVSIRAEDLESVQKLPVRTEANIGNWLNWIKEAQAKTTHN